MNPSTDPCLSTREWLSAQRDGEARGNPSGEKHLESCVACAMWSATSDLITRQVRFRAPDAPDSVSSAVASMVLSTSVGRDERVGRMMLTVAAMSGALVLVLEGLGLFGHSHLGSVDGRQAEALLIALIAGFAFAAWRPARLAAGLMPVAVLAAVITVGISVIEVAFGNVGLVDELSHIPLFVGALGSVFAARGAASATKRFDNSRTFTGGPIAVGSARTVHPA
ncbi:unannotated protein [freshwater metagenome]|uniref:Unannotated protein n=1 Tax=freshwater metagenome TaxID=449393 RepID=A0A6J6D7S5_9ZZZZ|nr:hypothetical protein [Actinomycetota bacterium]MTA87870.1 hypothetical protein [Actinomycetota bacterium]